MIISEYIFELLKEKGLSQKQFAELTGISQSTISDWKNKKTNPAADKILSICTVLGISSEDLLSAGQQETSKPDYLIIHKGSEAYVFFEKYCKLNTGGRKRLFLYLNSLNEKL